MKTKISLVLAFLTFLYSCAFAQTKETRNVDTFTKLSFRLPGKLYLKQGTPQSVVLEGKKEALEKVNTEVSGGKLTIESNSKWSDWGRSSDQFTVYVTVKDLDAISVSGSGDLIAQTPITGANFDLNVSGSGSLDAEIKASGDIDADLSGSGDINLKGSCANYDSDISGSGKIKLEATITGKAEFSVSGSGKIDASGSAQQVKSSVSGSGKVMASNLVTDKCEIHISGSGDVEVNVKTDLDATISGSGSVSYKGEPNHLNSHASGSGHIRKM
jgi:Putative auto-transporter adhesin, head GIN domain